ncbi:MAG TPA: hypothetical protein VKT77_04615 [Chthonomonadaceae bacterium]|nr:hypothetical protein [Chthonomonadaceae bacterium]
MRVLVTGARAPACLEWSRLLRRAGCAVAVADSTAVPLARFSSSAWYRERLPPADRDVHAYGEALLAAAKRFHADLILPTCEEALYIAHQKRRLERACPLFVSDFDLMARLHDKWSFAELARDLPIHAPPTERLETAAEVMEHAGRSAELVFKPVYSRFAARTLIRPGPRALGGIQPSARQPWIAQEFVPGRELCSYGLWADGALLAHACYHPKYRVGQGSGIYLDPVEHGPILQFAREFGGATGFTGQAGFDFIESAPGRLAVLECNPRATSGIHLFHRQHAELAAVLSRADSPDRPRDPLLAAGTPRRLSLAMALFAAPRLRSLAGAREFARDWRRATDIVAAQDDRRPAIAQLLGLGEVYLRAMRRRCSPLAAATHDIAWDGASLGAQPW